MKPSLISSHFLVFLPELIEQRGGNVAELVALAGLPANLFAPQPQLIPLDKHIRFLEVVAARLDWPLMPFDLAKVQSVSFLGSLYPLLPKRGTVLDWLTAFNQNLDIQVKGVTTSVEMLGKYGWFNIDTKLEMAKSSLVYQCHAIALGINMFQWLLGTAVAPRAVFFQHPEPDNAVIYSHYLHAPVAFNSATFRMSIDGALLQRQVSADINQLPQRLRTMLLQRPETSLTAQSKFVIESQITTGHCSCEMVSQALGMPLRSYQRKLAKEGTSFGTILDQIRVQRACSYLQASQYRMIDIAMMLGFADQACFSRSFRRWKGCTPRQWRTKAVSLPHRMH